MKTHWRGPLVVLGVVVLGALACVGPVTPTPTPGVQLNAPTVVVTATIVERVITLTPKPPATPLSASPTSQPPTDTAAPAATAQPSATRAPAPTAPPIVPTSTVEVVVPTDTAPAPAANCDPSYPDVCIPPPPPDLNCGDIPFRNFRVLPPDPHNFDGNNDGIGCVG